MDKTPLDTLTNILWPQDGPLAGQQVYWLLDGARDPGIFSSLTDSGLEHTCLFAGVLHPRLQAAAPYLVHLLKDAAATGLLLQEGWGKSWGILVLAAPEVSLIDQRLHFKKFLRVKTEDGKELAFRFYDPRVLNVYLPTCNPDEFKTFLGPLAGLIAEYDDGESVRIFGPGENGLQMQELALS